MLSASCHWSTKGLCCADWNVMWNHPHATSAHAISHTFGVPFFSFSFLQSKRSSTEINTQTTLSPRSCRQQLWDVRAKRVRISTRGPSHSQFHSMKKNYILKNSTFSKWQPLACKDCWCPTYLSETEPSIIISKWTAVSVYMLNCLNWLQPWFRSELWQLSQPAALNLSTLQITIFLNTSTTQVVVDQGHCKHVLTYSIQYCRNSWNNPEAYWPKFRKWKVSFSQTHTRTHPYAISWYAGSLCSVISKLWLEASLQGWLWLCREWRGRKVLILERQPWAMPRTPGPDATPSLRSTIKNESSVKHY